MEIGCDHISNVLNSLRWKRVYACHVGKNPKHQKKIE